MIASKLYLYAVILVAVFLALVGCMWWSYGKGEAHTQAKWDAEKVSAKKALDASKTNSDTVTTKVVTQYVDRVQTVYQKGNTITKKVPVYVTVKEDAACPIPDGFRSVLDAASQGSDLPASPSTAASGS